MDERMNEKRTKAAIKNEAANKLSNRRGTIAMARQTSPNTATSHFFINLVDNSRSPSSSRARNGKPSDHGLLALSGGVFGLDPAGSPVYHLAVD